MRSSLYNVMVRVLVSGVLPDLFALAFYASTKNIRMPHSTPGRMQRGLRPLLASILHFVVQIIRFYFLVSPWLPHHFCNA